MAQAWDLPVPIASTGAKNRGDAVTLEERLSEGETDGVGDSVAERLGDSVAEGLGDSLAEGLGDSDAEGLGVSAAPVQNKTNSTKACSNPVETVRTRLRGDAAGRSRLEGPK